MTINNNVQTPYCLFQAHQIRRAYIAPTIGLKRNCKNYSVGMGHRQTSGAPTPVPPHISVELTAKYMNPKKCLVLRSVEAPLSCAKRPQNYSHYQYLIG